MSSVVFGVAAAFPGTSRDDGADGLDQVAGPFAIPIVLADLAPRGEPPGTLQPVEIIVMPEAAAGGRRGRIGLDGEVPPQPVDAPVDPVLVFRGGPIATVDLVAGHLGVGLVEHVAGNHQRGNARTGHAAGAVHGLVVAPGTVVLASGC